MLFRFITVDSRVLLTPHRHTDTDPEISGTNKDGAGKPHTVKEGSWEETPSLPTNLRITVPAVPEFPGSQVNTETSVAHLSEFLIYVWFILFQNG